MLFVPAKAILSLPKLTGLSFCRKSDDTTEDTEDPLFLTSHPEVVYQAIQSVFFGALAISTLRFKYLWTPHMCLFAAGVFCNQHFWKTVLTKIGLKEIFVSASFADKTH